MLCHKCTFKLNLRKPFQVSSIQTPLVFTLRGKLTKLVISLSIKMASLDDGQFKTVQFVFPIGNH